VFSYVTGMEVDERTVSDALRASFEAHYAPLVRLSFLLAEDPSIAEDIVQDVFVRVAERIGSIPEDERRPYLRAAVVNAWRNERRRRAIERRRSSAFVRPEGSSVGQALEDRDVLWREVKRLPERQRACVVLRYYEDLPVAEIARLLGCRVGTVKSQLSRALAKLRRSVAR
jgi:RNA polymerase sigma-70 factor (sigma-E family)